MSIILDNTVGNFAAWQMSIFENASRLKYGQHAVHLSASLGAPTFREPPNADDIAVHVNYDVVSGRLELPKRWDHYPSYINAPCY